MPATYTEMMEGFRRCMSLFTCGGNVPKLILVKPIVYRAMLHDPSAELDLETEPDLISVGLVGYWHHIPVIRTQISAAVEPGWRFL